MVVHLNVLIHESESEVAGDGGVRRADGEKGIDTHRKVSKVKRNTYPIIFNGPFAPTSINTRLAYFGKPVSKEVEFRFDSFAD